MLMVMDMIDAIRRGAGAERAVAEFHFLIGLIRDAAGGADVHRRLGLAGAGLGHLSPKPARIRSHRLPQMAWKLGTVTYFLAPEIGDCP